MATEIASEYAGMALDRINTFLQSPLDAPLCDKAIGYGVSLLIVDTLISYGPLQSFILRFFRHSLTRKGGKKEQRKEQRKIVSQVAARIVGCIFLTMMFPFAFKTLLDPSLQQNSLYATSPSSINCIALASGYFLYDIFICVFRYTENDPAFLIHATLCCLAYAYPALSTHLHYIGAAFMMWEISTPLLYARWVMLKSGMHTSTWMMPVNYAFVFVFFLCRVVYGPFMSWQFWQATQLDLSREERTTAVEYNSYSNNSAVNDLIPAFVIYGYYVAMFTLNGLNYYWFSVMIAKAVTRKGKVL